QKTSVDKGYINEGLTIQDINNSWKCFKESYIDYEPSSSGISSNGTDEFSDSDISHIKILESEEHIHLSDKLTCAIRLFWVKSHCNLTDNTFLQTIMAVNSSN
ncbi:12634_t:CDS:2, partial [Funneliformis caledonium]